MERAAIDGYSFQREIGIDFICVPVSKLSIRSMPKREHFRCFLTTGLLQKFGGRDRVVMQLLPEIFRWIEKSVATLSWQDRLLFPIGDGDDLLIHGRLPGVFEQAEEGLQNKFKGLHFDSRVAGNRPLP